MYDFLAAPQAKDQQRHTNLRTIILSAFKPTKVRFGADYANEAEWENIGAAVRASPVVIKTGGWMEVRFALQSLINDGKIKRVGSPDVELYRIMK